MLPILTIALSVSVTYVICEITWSLWRYFDRSGVMWIAEYSDEPVRFSPSLGYLRSREESRWLKFHDQELVLTARFRGNSLGLGDVHDFGARRSHASERRIIVFGDSFTDGDYLQENWPDRVEATWKSAERGPILMNFSVGGAGLANWWRMLSALVIPDNFEVDGIVFAVFDGNLDRRFFFGEHRGYERAQYARVEGWDPSTYPQDSTEARKLLDQQAADNRSGHIVPSETIDWAIRESRLPDGIRPPFRLEIVHRLKQAFGSDGPPESGGGFNEWQLAFIEDFRTYAARKKIPILVIRIANKHTLGKTRSSPGNATMRFAELLEAEFVDGREAFDGLTRAEIKNYWYRRDGHWNQEGSNRFAGFAGEVIQAWWNRKANQGDDKPGSSPNAADGT